MHNVYIYIYRCNPVEKISETSIYNLVYIYKLTASLYYCKSKPTRYNM